ncbi:MAG: carotenoid oxygenase family protein [Patulibacter sp.]|nr:carotenoid oxygenase family protein [Patulibacter sp.]
MSTTPHAHPAPSPTGYPVGGTPRDAADVGFRDLTDELTDVGLELTGTIPAWLSGSLLRTGPARWDLTEGSVNHWFDGLAMLHRFAIADGGVRYANQLLRGKAGRAYEQTGRIGYREFATDPCRTRFQRIASLFDPGLTDNGAVNVGRLGERWLAMTETPLAVVFDPETLDSLGVERRAGKLSLPNAHPHYDHATGDMLDLRIAMGPRPRYEVVARHPAGGERVIAKIPVRRPGYQHSFGLTGRYAIVTESPLVFDPKRLAVSGRPFIENFRWRPEQGSRLWAIDRASGDVRGPWTAPAMFCFHHVNAFEDGDALTVDLLAYDDASVVQALAIDRLREAATPPVPTLRRYVLTAGSTAVEPRQLAATPFELPRINGRHQGRPYNVVFGTGSHHGEDGAAGGFLETVTKTTIDDGRTAVWRDPGAFAGEPIFVRRPDGADEDDGVLLTVVLEPARESSSLVVLDARDLGELARARVPHPIPFGFHGQFARA